MLRLLFICALLFLSLDPQAHASEQPADVSLVELLANPEHYDGKLVRCIGFLRLEFEGNALYLHREDYEHAILRNAFWVQTSRGIDKNRASLNMKYVLLEGVFRAGDHGHMGLFFGHHR